MLLMLMLKILRSIISVPNEARLAATHLTIFTLLIMNSTIVTVCISRVM